MVGLGHAGSNLARHKLPTHINRIQFDDNDRIEWDLDERERDFHFISIFYIGKSS